MRYKIVIFLVELISVSAFAEPNQSPSRRDAWGSPFEVDKETLKVLEEINLLNAYQTPKIGLKQDTIYAYTPKDVEPFRHVEPHKRHFLLQIEYTGPGRAISEPEHVESVKIGFIGPIM